MLLKSMGESFLLSKDEPLTPNIDGVMALWIFRNRAQTAENWQKSAKIGPLDSSLEFFSPPPPSPFVLKFFQEPHWKRTEFLKKSGRLGPFWSPRNKFAQFRTGHFPIQIHFSALWGRDSTSFFRLRLAIEYPASYRKVMPMTLATF